VLQPSKATAAQKQRVPIKTWILAMSSLPFRMPRHSLEDRRPSRAQTATIWGKSQGHRSSVIRNDHCSRESHCPNYDALSLGSKCDDDTQAQFHRLPVFNLA
jgi:hypothetical protein